MTSSPGTRRRSPSFGDVSAETRQQIGGRAGIHEQSTRECPSNGRIRVRTCAAKRPVVSQKSSEASTSERISAASKTLPDTGTAALSGYELARREGFAHSTRLPARGSCPDAVRLGAVMPTNSRYQEMVRSMPSIEREERRPVEHGAGSRRAQILAADFVGCFVKDLRARGPTAWRAGSGSPARAP